jgi:mono/diheme cytochrome c family protein
MRVKAAILILCVSVLAAILAMHLGSPSRFPEKTGRARAPRDGTASAGKTEAPAEQTRTNRSEGPLDGFYMSNGTQRVFVRYDTPDPLLRSFLQSVMDASSDPRVRGRDLFMKICAACHQRDGEGKDGVAPPLAGSEWVRAASATRLARIVLNGLTGAVQVRGKEWNLPMPRWREILNDDQVAVVLTYVRSELGDERASAVTPESIAAARREARATPETSDELLRIPDR